MEGAGGQDSGGVSCDHTEWHLISSGPPLSSNLGPLQSQVGWRKTVGAGREMAPRVTTTELPTHPPGAGRGVWSLEYVDLE